MTKIILSILLLGVFAQAKTTNSTKDLKTVLTQFVDAAGAGGVQQAYTKLREYFPVEQTSYDKMTVDFKSELEKYASKYGKYEGQKIVTDKSMGDDLQRVTFMMKYSKHPVMVDFYLFKTKAGWVVDSMYWNNSTKSFFTE